jgi:hypothetical protein
VPGEPCRCSRHGLGYSGVQVAEAGGRGERRCAGRGSLREASGRSARSPSGRGQRPGCDEPAGFWGRGLWWSVWWWRLAAVAGGRVCPDRSPGRDGGCRLWRRTTWSCRSGGADPMPPGAHPASCRARRAERCARWRCSLQLAALSAPVSWVKPVRMARGQAAARPVLRVACAAHSPALAGSSGVSATGVVLELADDGGWTRAEGGICRSERVSALMDCQQAAVTERYPVAHGPWTGSWTGCQAQ